MKALRIIWRILKILLLVGSFLLMFVKPLAFIFFVILLFYGYLIPKYGGMKI